MVLLVAMAKRRGTEMAKIRSQKALAARLAKRGGEKSRFITIA